MFTHPPRPKRLRLLLYLEWILLGIMAVGEGAQGLNILPRWPLLNGVGLLLFAGMGLHLPQHQRSQFLYVSLEIGLLLVTSLVGGLRLLGLWFVVMVMRNSQFLRRPYRLMVTVIAFGLFVALQFHRRNALNGLLWLDLTSDQMQRLWWAWMIVYGSILVFLQLLVDTILSEYHSRHHLSLANAQIRQYAAQVDELATSQERNRIAREIHDALGHSLTALNVHLEAVEKLWPVDPSQAQTLFREAQQLAKTALKDVRQSVAALRSDPMANQSLSDAIEDLLAELRRTQSFEILTDIIIDCQVQNSIKAAVYRIMQEAFTNILKHAEATVVILNVHATDQLRVLIQDNGKGFERNQNTTGFGLQSMQERAKALNGSCAIITAPGTGCQIWLSFPLKNENP